MNIFHGFLKIAGQVIFTFLCGHVSVNSEMEVQTPNIPVALSWYLSMLLVA